ncbi:response regulator transcription factor [Alicyclobacillus ferrooxydans]|uniref:Uncharacterized protein n=1 Tax=Alicyclobacillus ferrooxydans TaxID=471514 RepID=A0A0P9EWY2_9BACL|nr:response regulator transcription factor [Alicyclobacillus ferrooxydans]KPV43628.1 hypothetical protein AN477_11545 [Alicyclobacillus ferrooxydans]
MRLLLVDDEKRLAAAVKQLLIENNYAVDTAYEGNKGLDLALMNSYDLLILDVMLPGQSGLHIVKAVREAQLQVPILLLTARDAVDDRVKGLDAGADDYLVKPFANQELLARVRALCRRNHPLVAVDTLTVGPLSLNMGEHVIRLEDTPLSLTNREYQLLELLMRNHGKVLSKELILDRVWGPEADLIANAVENYIYFLRKKLEKLSEFVHIETVRGVGYVLRV